MPAEPADTLALLERLVAFPTISRDSNLELIEFVREFLRDRGIESRLYRDASGRKANLFATVGPKDRSGVLLSGHTDVVPVDGQSWRTDPFRLSRQDGAYFGRGAADMKGFLASALAAADRASRSALRVPLHLAFSHDEEIGCVGVRSLIDDMRTWTVRPHMCIVGEPTMMRVATAHKGKTAFKVTCRGHAAHSALATRGVNAIGLAARVITEVDALQARLAQSQARDSIFEIPYSTLNVGRISGGIALNVVPERCELEVEVRTLPSDSPTELIGALNAAAERAIAHSRHPGLTAGVQIEISNQYPALATPAEAAVARSALRLAREDHPISVSFGSEAGLFSTLAGIPTVVCGPGSIMQAHRADEFISAEQLIRCDRMLDTLINELK